ncbi:MAG: hypothetical protein RLZ98_3275 [Pseudomonadota bacterium]|jgi:hypothetical protein
MTAPPSGISETDWLSWPAAARTFILAQQQEIRAQREKLLVLRQENEQMRPQLTALAAKLRPPPPFPGGSAGEVDRGVDQRRRDRGDSRAAGCLPA